MNSLARYVLGLALLAGCAPPRAAAQGPPAPSGRRPAAEKGFVSLQGGFSVSLPAQVSSYRAVGFDVPEGRVEGDAYGWRTDDGPYELTHLSLPAGLANKGVLERARANRLALDPKAKLLSERELALAGASAGRELRLETPEGRVVVVRMYLAGSRLYELNVAPEQGREESALRALDSLRLLSQAEVEAARRSEAAAAEPDPLPQTPAAPRPKSDAQEEGLRGRVRTVFSETQDLSGTWSVSGRKPSSMEYYDERGDLTKKESYDSKGNLFQVTVYGYIDGERVSSFKLVRHEYDPPAPLAVGAAGPERKPDPRYSTMYKYKYDAEGRLVEESLYMGNGRPSTRSVYKYEADRRESLVYASDGSLNQRYLSTFDGKGNETEWVVYETRDGSVRNRYSYAYEFDARGNWVKRTTSKWVTKDGKSFFEPSHLTFRTITYY